MLRIALMATLDTALASFGYTACLDSEFGLGGETFSRMESVTCCFLTGLKVLVRISKKH